MNAVRFVFLTGNCNPRSHFWHVAVVSQGEASSTGPRSRNSRCYYGLDAGMIRDILLTVRHSKSV
jgi:hypothetical protein